MGEFKINITDMIIQAFGLETMRFYKMPNTIIESKYKLIDISKIGELADYQGSPIISSLQIDDAEDYQFRTKGMFFSDVLMDLNLERNIVKTSVDGLDGTIKEFISNGDWQINIMGILISDDRTKGPIEQIKEFTSLVMMKSSLRVSSPLLEAIRVYSIVVTQIDLPNSGNLINIRPFRISALSDLPVELEEIV